MKMKLKTMVAGDPLFTKSSLLAQKMTSNKTNIMQHFKHFACQYVNHKKGKNVKFKNSVVSAKLVITNSRIAK